MNWQNLLNYKDDQYQTFDLKICELNRLNIIIENYKKKQIFKMTH